MKLDKDLKDRIDRYFDSISADELYSILTGKYNFIDDNSDAGTVIVDDGKYLCRENVVSEFINDDIIYADIDVKQEVEVVKMKFLKDTSDSQNEEVVYGQPCSIPLAA